MPRRQCRVANGLHSQLQWRHTRHCNQLRSARLESRVVYYCTLFPHDGYRQKGQACSFCSWFSRLWCVFVSAKRKIPFDLFIYTHIPYILFIHLNSVVFLFQIGICLWLSCLGISIVWCAMGGWIVSERKRLRVHDPTATGADLFRRFSVVSEAFVVMIDIVAIIYYAFVSPFLTTVAHVLSLILGATLSLISIKRYDQDHGQSMESPTTPITPLMT